MKTLALSPIAEETDLEKTWLSPKEGEEKALEQIYLSFNQSLFQLGVSLKQDPDFTEDCIQKLFIDIWKYRKNLKSTDKVKIYLFRFFSKKNVAMEE